VTRSADAGEMIMVIKPAGLHPLDDAFVEVRGESPADIEVTAAADPAFEEVEGTASAPPRTLTPAAVAGADAFAPVAPETVEPPVKSEAATAARYAELQRKLAERSGLGGFQGFCPVALRDRRELMDARPEFLSVYQGRTYEVASAEAKARFEADPEKYAPVNQGNDLVLVSRGEAEVEGNLSHAVWFKDRLYLFRSTATLREFNADPTKFALAE
jgi:YHS domain-containing protein